MLRESGPRVAYVSWWLAGLLVLPGCFGLFAQPKTPPKVKGKAALLKTRPQAAEARARSGWDLQYPDLTPPDPKSEAEAAGGPAKTSLTATGWQLRRPNLAPKAPASLGEGRASGWEVSWPYLPTQAELEEKK